MRAFVFLGAGVTGALAALVFACGSDSSSDQPPPPDGGEASVEETGTPTDGAVDAGPPAPTDPAGGSRIQVRSIETDDGARIFSTLYDTKLAVECGVGYAEDGVLRCLPSSPTNIGTLYNTGCAAPVAIASKSACNAPPFAHQFIAGADACSNKLAMYHLGAKTTAVFTKGASTCDPFTLDPNQDYYDLGAKIAPAEMVAYTLQNVPASPTLSVRMFVGEDGSRARFNQLFDTTRAQPCLLGLGADLKTRCIPSANAQATFFGESTCATRVGVVAQCHIPQELVDTTTAISSEPPPACTPFQSYTVYTAGAVRASKDIYNKLPGGCLGPTTSTTDTIDLGAEIPAATFPEVTYDTKPGTTRILQKVFTASGAPLTDRVALTDATLGVSCSFNVAADGKTRCLPTSAFAAEYTDALCSQPLAEDQSGCEPVKYAIVGEPLACGSKTHVHTIGAKIDPPPVDRWFGTPTDCIKAGSAPSAKGYYAVGPEVDPTTFVEGHTATR